MVMANPAFGCHSKGSPPQSEILVVVDMTHIRIADVVEASRPERKSVFDQLET